MENRIEERNIINFYELDEEWQAEAKSNLGAYAEENHYLEPEENHNPIDHILWDLSEAMSSKGTHNGFEYNVTIGISNNSGILLQVDDCFETAKIIFV